MDSLTESAKPQRAKSSLWDRKLLQLALFVATYLAASAITCVLHREEISFNSVLGCLLDFGLFSLLLPGGLFPIWTLSDISMLLIAIPVLWLVGWFVYLWIPFMAMRLNSRRFFVVLYVLFVILLVLNVGGCTTWPQINTGIS